jgi:hypothetical protein
VYWHNAARGQHRICALDGGCEIAPTGTFIARAQVEVETAASSARNYKWWCSDNGSLCYLVTNNSSGWVSYTDSTRDSQTLLTNQLSLDEGAILFRTHGDKSNHVKQALCSMNQSTVKKYPAAGKERAVKLAVERINCLSRPPATSE